MQENENYQSKAAEVQSMPNVEDSCSDGECYLACVPPLECVNLWRYAECRYVGRNPTNFVSFSALNANFL